MVKNPPASARDADLIPGSCLIPLRRKWQSTPVFLPEKSHGQRNLVGYSPWDRKGLDTTERLSTDNTAKRNKVSSGRESCEIG